MAAAEFLEGKRPLRKEKPTIIAAAAFFWVHFLGVFLGVGVVGPIMGLISDTPKVKKGIPRFFGNFFPRSFSRVGGK